MHQVSCLSCGDWSLRVTTPPATLACFRGCDSADVRFTTVIVEPFTEITTVGPLDEPRDTLIIPGHVDHFTARAWALEALQRDPEAIGVCGGEDELEALLTRVRDGVGWPAGRTWHSPPDVSHHYAAREDRGPDDDAAWWLVTATRPAPGYGPATLVHLDSIETGWPAASYAPGPDHAATSASRQSELMRTVST